MNGPNRLNRLTQISLISLAICACAAGWIGTRTSAQTPPPAACGGRGQPHCPLQGWMEDTLTPAVEAQDVGRLATLYAQLANWAPDQSWNTGTKSWRANAENGAARARANDFAGARAACKSCHQAWRERYEREYRPRALPGVATKAPPAKAAKKGAPAKKKSH